jgi:hypothetical protein
MRDRCPLIPTPTSSPIEGLILSYTHKFSQEVFSEHIFNLLVAVALRAGLPALSVGDGG